VTIVDSDSEFRQIVGDLAGGDVGAAYLKTEVVQNFGYPRHSGTPDTYEVQFSNLSKHHFSVGKLEPFLC